MRVFAKRVEEKSEANPPHGYNFEWITTAQLESGRIITFNDNNYE